MRRGLSTARAQKPVILKEIIIFIIFFVYHKITMQLLWPRNIWSSGTNGRSNWSEFSTMLWKIEQKFDGKTVNKIEIFWILIFVISRFFNCFLFLDLERNLHVFSKDWLIWVRSLKDKAWTVWIASRKCSHGAKCLTTERPQCSWYSIDFYCFSSTFSWEFIAW